MDGENPTDTHTTISQEHTGCMDIHFSSHMKINTEVQEVVSSQQKHCPS